MVSIPHRIEKNFSAEIRYYSLLEFPSLIGLRKTALRFAALCLPIGFHPS